MAPLNIFYQNVRGLRTKTSTFYRNVCVNNYDIICITETWLLEGISDSELFDNRLADLVLKYPSDAFLILGDFNQPNIKWCQTNDLSSLYPSDIQGDVQRNFIDNLNICNLSQYNCFHNIHDRILDLVLSNNDISVTCCADPLVCEDPQHKALCISVEFVQLHSLPTRPRLQYLYNKGDYNAIKRNLDSVNWDYELRRRSFEDAVSYFYDTINDQRNIHIPSRIVTIQSKFPVWYNSSLIKIIKEKAKYHLKFKKYKNLSDHHSFVVLRQRVKDLEKELFNNYISGIESNIKRNPKAFWAYVKSKKQSNCYPSVLQYGNHSSGDGDVISNMFSDYFYSNFLEPSAVNNNSPPINTQTVPEGAACFGTDIGSIEINRDEVYRFLKHVDLNKSPGPDNIPPVFIVNCADSLTLPLSILFQLSLTSGVVPTLWKSAYITPVLKKGSKAVVENYRPISKLCAFAKIMEKMFYRQVYAALKLDFCEYQHGFIKGRSTTSNLILCSDFISDSMANGSQVDVIYTDYSKCFDKIDHNILLSKLSSMGIRGNLFRWFSSYVENRCQTVVLNGYSSRTRYIPSGVPQGSLLGPLLFNIFVNDITHCFQSSKILLYADDMKIMKQINSVADALSLQEDLDRFQNYCVLNGLDLNVSKCYICTFTRKLHPIAFPYKLQDSILVRVGSVKDLGVIFDSKLLLICILRASLIKPRKR
ncbi:unnamed protein product [Pieris macdunnoughi]|uniref:Reverse transcriptase domain-containing protein n=1 Tax=Pieris macdunnoughi TaxID=345717 RepID=A0A821M6B1_9NEOP|nr:unnamed protein product [Pieris macdunnoughi]